MKKITLFLTAILLVSARVDGQTVIPISQARAQPVGSSVTIRGIILNDASKMGWTYYIQDETGGIAGYSMVFTNVGAKQSDIVVVKGTLKNYNSLLEISPVESVTIESSNNPLPDPAIITINEIITGTGGEDYESMLIKINNVHFDPALQGTLFSAGTSGFNYNITDDAGITMQVRILPNTDINNTLIPIGKISITGCLGQYSPSNPNTGYQLVPRTLEDIIVNSSIKLTTPVSVSDLTPTSITLTWTTDNIGSTFIKYGHTKYLEMGAITGSGNTTDHSVVIPGSASELFYAKAYSVSATVPTDTAKSSIGAYITESNSTGAMKVYFNTPVDNSVSSGTNAIYVDKALDDTLINYINRAKLTIDIAIYNFNNDGISNITTAINAAATRGVNVRMIYCGTTANLGTDQLNSSVHKLQGPGTNNTSYPTRDGIMHNKFMIVDVNSTNANDPLVWTGSMNWTDGNINLDANNVIIIQDQSLARTYLVEFEEMWGSNTLNANAVNAKFGNTKTDNTPHKLKVGGNWFECYFSPTDNVNVEIINRIKTAQTDMEAAVMLITRKEMAYAISDAAEAGASVKFLVSSFSDEILPGTGNPPVPDSTVFKVLKQSCSQFGDYTGGGIMHNKYMIIDQGNTASDPLVWTGSHNWSAGANNSNDENSIVIHDATVANLYHQNFVKLMTTADVLYSIDDPAGYTKGDVAIYPNPATDYVNINVKATKAVEYKITLSDISGRQLIELRKKAEVGTNHEGFNVSGFPSGIYILRIASHTGSYVQKLIVR
jgi:phosphatidylserine/phosphatidylglycerophosphate/cardiolipin synthase-like enzyme